MPKAIRATNSITAKRNMSPLSSDLPTIEELSKDPFMKQVSHAEKLVNMLQARSEDETLLESLLVAQLNHADGIRGFFVTYLTGESSAADNLVVPDALQKAMKQVDEKELIPLVCMNVVMPTGMITMHTDLKLSEQAKKTSERGLRILASMKSSKLVQENCNAILAVATDGADGSKGDASLAKYWSEFFEKWGYKEAEKKNISAAISNVI